jgi:hypothetical protein
METAHLYKSQVVRGGPATRSFEFRLVGGCRVLWEGTSQQTFAFCLSACRHLAEEWGTDA